MASNHDAACSCPEAGRDPLCAIHGSFAGDPSGRESFPLIENAMDNSDALREYQERSAATSTRPWLCEEHGVLVYEGRCPDCRMPWEHGPVVTRLLALINVALIPYVWAKFPREAGVYTRRSFGAVLRGR